VPEFEAPQNLPQVFLFLFFKKKMQIREKTLDDPDTG
jgi:hypothetical protein